ncbi:related to agmatinase [Ramularia collo-cygni]|uniref:Related to agmatinase n=1 Tax=Ramularia collo-cygni TaxID=112498 RepID=A0A2D3UQE0_9PEZI|nr:related to agmatinase [Ramularia collo-cygni]CZT15405.1 related to agmatinase [Ramularia collo-cygni]
MTEAVTDLLARQPASSDIEFPRLIVLGGDHLISLPVLRAIRSIYGSPIRVLHFDSHLDTLSPAVYPSTQASPQSHYNHGTVFWHAAAEGLLDDSGSVHVGTNTRLSGDNWSDYDVDDAAGFVRIPATAIDDQGSAGIIRTIKDLLPDGTRIYLSIDIDVLDPAFAPGTGAPEPGGWSTRELLSVLRGVLPGLDVIAADVVEVAPAYDNPGGDTAFAAAGLVYEVISAMVAGIVTNTTRPTSGPLDGLSDTSRVEL